MELKGYQLTNLNALDRFLTCVEKSNNTAKGYSEFWRTNNPPISPRPKGVIEPYKDNVKGAPHVCLKVPTGGGKTFIAAAALNVAMSHYTPQYKVVVWLVPSNAILEQTLRNLRNKEHPYRQRIDTDFHNRVVVLDKQQALMGHEFTLNTVRENLCILVMSFDSFRAKNKEDRKVYQENGNLQSFAPLVSAQLNGDEEVQLMTVLQAVNPVVIVDESHNATSKLSEDMLNDLQPLLVVDLTATPRANSNVICFTDALELKKANMVKLPVIVYNHSKKSQVYDSALHLRKQLEIAAEQEKSGRYIRPIVLFQAESKLSGDEDRETFETIKKHLLELDIPEEQIKIKTADFDELKGIDLMSPSCPVRYIITVNALKEGWDCPFAYILASLADKSSVVDVEQIVGRVLRLPNAKKNSNSILNLSYVLTASSKFQETLNNVVKGLNHAGFSSKDCRSIDTAESEPETESPAKPHEPPKTETLLFDGEKPQTEGPTEEESFDKTEITFRGKAEEEPAGTTSPSSTTPTSSQPESVVEILEDAQIEDEKMTKQIEQNNSIMVPHELTPAVKEARIQSIFVESAQQVKLPEFYTANESDQTGLFGLGDVKFDRQHLLKSFVLSKQKADINFAAAAINMAKVDIDETTDDHTPRHQKVKEATYRYILSYIQEAKSLEDKKQRCSDHVAGVMGKMTPLTQKDIQKYVARIFEGFSEAELDDFMQHLSERTQTIKEKILALEEEHKENEFCRLLDAETIFVKPTYSIPDTLILSNPTQSIVKMLHTKEESVNDFEEEVINDVANLDNVEWWTFNNQTNGFCINGFINHYPDFIIKTKKGKIVILETKGDHLDAKKKIKLGNLWANSAGKEYKYCLVYNKRQVEGAYTKSDFLELMKNL